MASRDACRMANELVKPTCPKVDEAFAECIRVVKEYGTELLREALEDVCQEKIDLEKEKEALEDHIKDLQSELDDAKEEISRLRKLADE